MRFRNQSLIAFARGVMPPVVCLAIAVATGASLLAPPASAGIPIDVTIKDHRFTPAEIHVPAGKPATLNVKNEDATAEEFESHELKIEKVIAARQAPCVCGRSIPANIPSSANITKTPPKA